MAGKFWAVCYEYAAGPYRTRKAAEDATARFDCPLDHEVKESDTKPVTGLEPLQDGTAAMTPTMTFQSWTWDGEEIHGVTGLARHIPDGTGVHQVTGTAADFADHLRSLGVERLETGDPELLRAWGRT